MLESFDDDASLLLQSYHTGQVDLLKKKIRCLLFGQPPGVKKVMGVLLECEDSNKGNFDEEERRNLFAGCFMEHVSLILCIFTMVTCLLSFPP